MQKNTAASKLIHAGVPGEWRVADKTGSGSYGTRNDIVIIRPPNKKPIDLAILSNYGKKDTKYDDKLIAEVTKIVLDALKATNKY